MTDTSSSQVPADTGHCNFVPSGSAAFAEHTTECQVSAAGRQEDVFPADVRLFAPIDVGFPPQVSCARFSAGFSGPLSCRLQRPPSPMDTSKTWLGEFPQPDESPPSRGVALHWVFR